MEEKQLREMIELEWNSFGGTKKYWELKSRLLGFQEARKGMIKIEDVNKMIEELEKEILCLIGEVRFETDDKEGYDFPYPEIKRKVKELKQSLQKLQFLKELRDK